MSRHCRTRESCWLQVTHHFPTLSSLDSCWRSAIILFRTRWRITTYWIKVQKLTELSFPKYQRMRNHKKNWRPPTWHLAQLHLHRVSRTCSLTVSCRSRLCRSARTSTSLMLWTSLMGSAAALSLRSRRVTQTIHGSKIRPIKTSTCRATAPKSSMTSCQASSSRLRRNLTYPRTLS